MRRSIPSAQDVRYANTPPVNMLVLALAEETKASGRRRVRQIAGIEVRSLKHNEEPRLPVDIGPRVTLAYVWSNRIEGALRRNSSLMLLEMY